MKVYSLVGKSGTGKSFQAINLCKKLNIQTIVDDGLLITGNSILSGTSAKRQPTKIKAIKTALFTEDTHRDEVALALRKSRPASLLIIGTSEKMVRRIAARLEIPEPMEIIRIEEITTEEERKTADRQRHEMGKHIIPVPALQLKKEFSGYFLDPLRIFKDLRGGKHSYPERSVVRPTFSYLGNFTISPRAIADIAAAVARRVEGVDELLKVHAIHDDAGLTIQVSAVLEYGTKVLQTARILQHEIGDQVETMTAFHIQAVDIEVKGLKIS